jgi:required for meiotic nuclear division protein 1
MTESDPIVNLPYSPATGHVREITVRADYFEGQFDLKLFRAKYPHYPVLATDPLVIEPQRGAYAVLTKFGSVVFWGCMEPVIQELFEEIKALPGALSRDEEVKDQLTVFVGKDQDQITFHEIWLRQLNLNNLKIISLALGQSVALENFEIEVQSVLRTFEPVVSALRTRGGLVLSEREVMRAVGFALDVRAAVLANLTLFDSPPETWESEALTHLDSRLYDYFDLEERMSAINQKIGFLTDVNATLITLLNNRKSHRLEWIIIVLIFIEMLFFVIVQFIKH